MSRPSPEEALERYTEHLKQTGVATKQLTLARHFLRHMLSTLRDLPQDSNGYRIAAENTIRNFPEDTHFGDMVREFFPYWNGEECNHTTSQPAAAIHPPQARTVDEAIHSMEADPWAHANLPDLERHLHQLKSLARYAAELKRHGMADDNISLRVRLVKLLLFTIRDAPQNTDTYRAGVDKILLLFPHQERWHTFVSLAREFFYFLANDASAAERLQPLSTEELVKLMAP